MSMDDKTARNSNAPTKLGRMGLIVLRRSPRGRRRRRIFELNSANHLSRASSPSSSSSPTSFSLTLPEVGVTPGWLEKAESRVDARRMREPLLVPSVVPCSSSAYGCSGTSTWTSASALAGKWCMCCDIQLLSLRLLLRFSHQCQATTVTT